MKKMISLLTVVVLGGCAQPGQNQYSFKDVGQSMIVEFGTVLNVREVDITGENTGVGGLVGAGTGAGAASYVGNGTGNAWAIAGGAIIGGIAGLLAEQGIANGKGIEYVICKENGQTMTIVQLKNENDKIFPIETRVMIQTSGSYQRVLPADGLPHEIKRPRGIKMAD